MKAIKLFTIVAFFILQSATCIADEFYYDLIVKCDPDKDYAEIIPEGIWNAPTPFDQTAECTLKSGKTVRAKMGVGSTRPYGMNGGIPDLWLSVWINKVKIISKAYFSCDDEGPCSIKIVVDEKGVSVCRTITPEGENEDQQKKETCETTAYTILPQDIDRIEYPQKGDKIPPKPGEVVEIYSKDKKICDCFQKKISEKNFSNESSLRNEISKFDFDNDGKDEDVIWHSAATHYRDGAVFFISRTGSLPKTKATNPLTGNRLYEYGQKADRIFPHYWAAIREGQENEFETIDNGGSFIFKGNYRLWWEPNNKFVGSLVRYMRITPEKIDNKTYLLMDSVESGNEGWYAILMPEPDDSVTEMCIFNRVSEHY